MLANMIQESGLAREAGSSFDSTSIMKRYPSTQRKMYKNGTHATQATRLIILPTY
ncbi:hypothetical protein HanPI659440_Chr05g0213861 [Helianthus annuus]|nr:hypothetical protein HanPI659440_Chr05g0213861 [Helianthus annuus]